MGAAAPLFIHISMRNEVYIMLRSESKRIIITVLLFLMGCSFAVDAVGQICPWELRAAAVGNPVVLERDTDFLCAGIRQIVADEEYLYVLFGPYGAVQVYTLEGTYLYSISVYNHLNGRIQIAVKESLLYICDKVQNVYVFSGKDFTAFLDHFESASIREQLSLGLSDPRYAMQAASLWRDLDTPEEQCVLQRPDWLVLYQGSVNWLMKFALMIAAGVIIFFQTPKKKEDAALPTH